MEIKNHLFLRDVSIGWKLLAIIQPDKMEQRQNVSHLLYMSHLLYTNIVRLHPKAKEIRGLTTKFILSGPTFHTTCGACPWIRYRLNSTVLTCFYLFIIDSVNWFLVVNLHTLSPLSHAFFLQSWIEYFTAGI